MDDQRTGNRTAETIRALKIDYSAGSPDPTPATGFRVSAAPQHLPWWLPLNSPRQVVTVLTGCPGNQLGSTQRHEAQ
ncbi:hypothetical protein ACIPXK_23545 [Streptomyces sp. NPDC090051]|uniref:hypothetical protein n=1 Tax=unclassified Streptomyces TaxID=2593676 RepID=UPI002E0D68D6|nr:hypothetical protein OG722_33505 [Streptomyces sp. NBC_01212]WSR05021.1 hypothetical protein OG265_03000 [Streptomyces sp. NBC_01208]